MMMLRAAIATFTFAAFGAFAGPIELVKDINDSARWGHDDKHVSLSAKLGSNYIVAVCGMYADCDPWITDGTPGTLRLLKDLRSGGWTADPVGFTTVGDRVYFIASADDGSEHVWVTDGTEAGTVIVDLPPDVRPSGYARTAGLGSNFFFVSDTNDLWKTDGTGPGTRLIAHVDSPTSLSDYPLMAAGGWVYFVTSDLVHGRELWKTDGTAAGTGIVKDINPGTASSGVHSFSVTDGKVFFTAYDGSTTQMFVTDGTDAGTVALGLVTVYQDSPMVMDGAAYFFRQIATDFVQLWRSDGTVGGATMVSQWPYQGLPDFHWAAAGGRLYFLIYNGGWELWSTDGTPGGTQAIKRVSVSAMMAFKDAVYFGDYTDLWRTEGTAATTTVVLSGTVAGPVRPVQAVGDMLLLDQWSALWITDGTPAGTAAFHVPAGNPSHTSGECTANSAVRGAEVFFFAQQFPSGCQLWKSDGTSAGTSMVHDLSPGQTSIYGEGSLAVAGNTVFFTGSDSARLPALWKTDGTDAGTVKLATFGGAGSTNFPRGLVALGNDVYFSITGSGVWKSDGTSAGTIRLVPNPGGFGLNLTVQGGMVFFTLMNNSGFQLWRTDGTLGGTLMLRGDGVADVPLQAATTQLYFIARDPATGLEVWRTDGTVAGTRMVKDIRPGPDGGAIRIVGAIGDTAIFRGWTGPTDTGLWKTDGTDAGTQFLADVDPFDAKGVLLDGRLFFVGDGPDVWRTDGTPSGTVRVTNDQVVTSSLHVAGGTLFFTGFDQLHGEELRMSSGSPGPTTLVEDFIPGPNSMWFDTSYSPGFAPAALPAGLFFRASGRIEGNEPYLLPFDSTPEPITFAPKNAPAATIVFSDAAKVTGINAATTATASNGQVCVSSTPACGCDVQPLGASRTVGVNEYVCLSHTTSATQGASVTTGVNVGGVTASFTSTAAIEVGVVQFSAATQTVIEGTNPSATLTVNRNGSPGATASVAWSITSGTAIAGTDYSGPTTGVVSWSAGDGTPKTIVIPILNDAVPEATKQFTVTLASPVNLTVGSNAAIAVTLVDDDQGWVLSAPAVEVSESQASVVVPVTRIGPAGRSASTVRWTAMNGSAIAGQDFGTKGSAVAPSGTITFAGGETGSKNIVIPILQDLASEGPETFTIMLSDPSTGTAIGVPTAITVTIVDDDIPAESAISFSQSKYLVMENDGNAVVTLHRTPIGGGFTTSATVSYATAPGTALATSDYMARSGSVTWTGADASDKTITIPIVNNTVAEPHESFTVTITPTTAGIQIDAPQATVTIVDDDDVFPKFGVVPDGWIVPAAAAKGWHASNDAGAYEGVFSLRSDAIEDGETSQIEVTRDFAAGNITFRAKVSSEAGFDVLRFFVDGVERASWSGTTVTGWQMASIPIGAGSHTVRWSYEKDASASVGFDAAWIDAVTLP